MIDLLAGLITTNAGPEPAQVVKAPVPNKSAAKEEVELTTRITVQADNSINEAVYRTAPATPGLLKKPQTVTY